MTADDDGLAVEQFGGETLRTRGNSRAEQLLAVTAVMRRVPEDRYREEILAALFAQGRPQRHHGDKPPPSWIQARAAYLERARAWLLATSGRVPVSSSVPAADLRAYEAATGDHFTAPAQVPDAP